MFKFNLQDNCKMIDYKYSNPGGITVEEVYENSLLDFTSPVNLKTGEIVPGNRHRKKTKYPPREEKTAVYNNLEISIVNGRHINLKGSYHEYFSGGQNHADFTLTDFLTVIKDLDKKFHFNPGLDLLHNIEFGVNVKLPFDTKTFLRSIISFKGKEYELRRYNGQGYMIKFSFDQYELKIYDKGFQYRLQENLLRFEIKVTTMQFLRSKGIYLHSSKDLLLHACHSRLGALLNDFFGQLVIYDHSIKINTLQPRVQRLLREGQNPKYWSQLKETNPENYKKKVRRFRELVAKHGTQKRPATVQKLITDKWDQLTRTTSEQQRNIDNYLGSMLTKTFPEIIDPIKIIFPQNKTSSSVLNRGNFISSFTQESAARITRLLNTKH
jgi:hypothetical protein